MIALSAETLAVLQSLNHDKFNAFFVDDGETPCRQCQKLIKEGISDLETGNDYCAECASHLLEKVVMAWCKHCQAPTYHNHDGCLTCAGQKVIKRLIISLPRPGGLWTV